VIAFGNRKNMHFQIVVPQSGGPEESHLQYRVTGGGYPPPVPTERSVRISRTTLFRNRFTTRRVIAVPYREAPTLVAAKENEP
jgi:hypothetical protein